MNQLSTAPDGATLVTPIKAYPTAVGAVTRIRKRNAVKNEIICFLKSPVSGTAFKYTGNKGSNTDENCRRTRYRREKKSDRNLRGGKSKMNLCSDPSASDRKTFGSYRDDTSGGKTIQSHRCRTMQRRWVPRCDRWPDLNDSSRDSFFARSERTDCSSGLSSSDLDDGKRCQRRRESKLPVLRPLNELLACTAEYFDYKTSQQQV